MTAIALKKLCDYPEYLDKTAQWFSQIWNISIETYKKIIYDSIDKKTGIPQWYIVLNNTDKIIAGAGIIENDFHNRKDLTPNLCALFVEKEYRKNSIAKYILNFARKDLANMGFKKLYLITDHTEFHEKCGWNFLTTVKNDDGNFVRMYATSTFIEYI